MQRILGSIVLAAAAVMCAAAFVNALPAFAGSATARVVGALAPSPSVSVTTLPQLPTVAPVQPTYAPATQPTSNAGSGGVMAAPGTVIQVVGDVADPRVLTLKDLQLLRRSSLTLHVLDPDGKRRVHIYTGVLLRDLIATVSPTGPGGAVTSTRAYALVEGINGDSAIIAFPEFEQAYNNKQILVAYLVDGAPFPGQAIGQLIVPEDQTQGRFISAISTIRIGSPAP